MSKIDYKLSSTLCVLFIAIAIIGEYVTYYDVFITYRDFDYLIFLGIATLALCRAFFVGIDRWFSVFFLSIAYIVFHDFRDTPNHVYLSLCLLIPLVFYPNKQDSETYSDFVRQTLGIVMIAAATQKIISGNFLNGHFLKYLAFGNTPNEQVLSAVCFGQNIIECDALMHLSILSITWQYAIGILLLINCRHILAFAAEFIFILGIGFVTDEMNFQTVNIAALLIAFRITAPPIIFIGLILLLLSDLITVGAITGVFF